MCPPKRGKTIVRNWDIQALYVIMATLYLPRITDYLDSMPLRLGKSSPSLSANLS